MSTLFSSPIDLAFALRQQADLHWRRFPDVEFHSRQAIPAGYDRFYGEVPEEDALISPTILIPAYVLLNPAKARLEKWGINEEREIEVHFGRGVLERGRKDNGVVTEFPEPNFGDIVVELGEAYEFLEVHRGDYFANTREWTTLFAFGVKYSRSHLGSGQRLVAETSKLPPILGVYDREPE